MYEHVRFVDSYKRERKDVDKINQSQIHEKAHLGNAPHEATTDRQQTYARAPKAPLDTSILVGVVAIEFRAVHILHAPGDGKQTVPVTTAVRQY